MLTFNICTPISIVGKRQTLMASASKPHRIQEFKVVLIKNNRRMDNELLIEKPWWKRNVLWLSATIIILGFVVTCSSFFLNGNLYFYALANADPSFYNVAIDSANKNQSVVEKFGHIKPIENKEIYDGKAFYSNNKNSLNIVLPVNGIKESGIMNLWLHRNSRGWKYDSIIIKNSITKITVLKATSTSQ